MNYLLLISVILVFGVQTLCFKIFSRVYMRYPAGYFVFNSLYFSVVVAIFLAFGVRFAGVHTETLLLALAFGVVFVASIYLYMRSMESGPLSLSSLVFSFGLLVPIACGAIFWHEGVNILQAVGLVLLFFTFYLGGETRQEIRRRLNVKWVVYSVAALLGNGALMALSKAQQMLLPGKEIREFLVVAFATAALVSLGLFLLRRFRMGEKSPQLKGGKFALLVLGAGITTAFGNLLGLILSGRLPAVVQFPVQNGGIVFISSVISVFVYREKMTRNACIGLLLGLAAMVLICL